jgi:hypothetical protein
LQDDNQGSQKISQDDENVVPKQIDDIERDRNALTHQGSRQTYWQPATDINNVIVDRKGKNAQAEKSQDTS